MGKTKTDEQARGKRGGWSMVVVEDMTDEDSVEDSEHAQSEADMNKGGYLSGVFIIMRGNSLSCSEDNSCSASQP